MLFYTFPFLYCFLPLALMGYFLLGSRSRSLSVQWVVVCSLVFYGWWNPAYVLLLICSIAFNYSCGMRLLRHQSKLLLTAGVAINLSTIGYFKYAGFFLSIYSDVSGNTFSLAPILLPLGISFFTFQQISWLVDAYSRKVSISGKGLWEYAQFVTFFPQLIAGPIVHHSEMMPQFFSEKSRYINWPNIALGLSFLVIGLAKKVIIADLAAPHANTIFTMASQGQQLGFADAWLGALAYTVQIYFDFSGYADMAIGLALLFNIKLPLNFNSPYTSLNIAEFWRRWHMTLGRFLRDYLYIPLGGSKCSRSRSSANLLTTMFLCGLWHGAGWTFVLWGVMHGLFLVIHRVWGYFSFFTIPGYLARLITFIAVVLAWVLFRAEDMHSAWNILSAMLLPEGMSRLPETEHAFYRQSLAVITPALLLAFLAPNSQVILNYSLDETGHPEPKMPKTRKATRLQWQPNLFWGCYMALLCVLTLYCLLDQSTVQEFIYFQF